MNFGKSLKTIRLVRGYHQKEIAKRAHMDERTLRDLEAGRTRISAEQVEKFAAIYKVEVKFIYELARGPVLLQSIIHETKRNGIEVKHDQNAGNGIFDYLVSRLDGLEVRIRELEGQ